jgi:hypothetical protein
MYELTHKNMVQNINKVGTGEDTKYLNLCKIFCEAGRLLEGSGIPFVPTTKIS